MVALEAKTILQSVERLALRIHERFPGSDLGQIGSSLVELSWRATKRSEELSKPMTVLRLTVAAGIALLLAGVVAAVLIALVSGGPARDLSFVDIVQSIEAGVNDLIFVCIATYFLVSLEARIKRRKRLKALYELRALAHVIDMAQLVIDPSRIADDALNTPSSPRRTFSSFQMARYLDYCSEMLSHISKVAVLYAEGVDDGDTLAAVDDIEALTNGLSRKMWQKIMILYAQPALSR